MQLNTLKIVYENLHFHKGLTNKYLSNKNLLIKLIDKMQFDIDLTDTILDNKKYVLAVNDLKTYLTKL
jgi:hypothetical protein